MNSPGPDRDTTNNRKNGRHEFRAGDITGLVLAGGMGMRFGGIDKGLVTFEGRPMIAHVLDKLAPQCHSLIISCNRNVDHYAAYGYPVQADTLGQDQGPLAGVHACLPRISTPLALVCCCDYPRLPATLVDTLLNAYNDSNVDLCFARNSDRDHFLLALMRSDLFDSLSAYLSSGQRSVQHWYRTLQHKAVDLGPETVLLNLNDLESLRRAEQSRDDT